MKIRLTSIQKSLLHDLFMNPGQLVECFPHERRAAHALERKNIVIVYEDTWYDPVDGYKNHHVEVELLKKLPPEIEELKVFTLLQQ